VCFAKVTILTSVTYRYLKVSVLWLHMHMQPQYRYLQITICNRSQNCNFSEAHTGRELADDGLCKPKHVGANIIILNDFNGLTIL